MVDTIDSKALDIVALLRTRPHDEQSPKYSERGALHDGRFYLVTLTDWRWGYNSLDVAISAPQDFKVHEVLASRKLADPRESDLDEYRRTIQLTLSAKYFPSPQPMNPEEILLQQISAVYDALSGK